MSAHPPLPALLETNPRLDQWVKFSAPGRVTVSTGRVEIGQGVLTAMRQIAATGEAPADQSPGIGCSIKWRSGR